MTMDLNELADRVEALTGPDREVDVAIFKMMGAPVPFQFANKIVALCYDESERCYFAPLGDMRVRYEPPAYTASIDAAMMLIDDGAGVYLERMFEKDGARWDAAIYIGAGPVHRFYANRAHSAPLALTAAALRSKALGAVHTLEGGL